ncbi:ChbG/HpnK family deacetylase [uncultured Faecalibaculum sp.]|uniref:ChbG/HpnK family deacetylase n=1 Tax=uncultured Faecalibaculum sp. TaxID=1729681 RepID=UPI0025F2D9B5|nr:ChbG/HpnK family deacetylase [uncultured Faecalibaculum sp.]
METVPGAACGMHLCITAGSPLTKPASLMIPDGTFDKSVWALQKPCDLQELETELRAQIQRFRELTGQLPEHLDSHHGIERIPGGAAILVKLAWEYDRPLRQFIAFPMEEGDTPFEVPALVLVSSQNDDPLTPEDILERVREFGAADTVELALHPGRADEDLARLSGLTTGRNQDAANLMSETFGRFLDREDVQLISWQDLARSRC